MAAPLRFYFDFISPFAYLGWTQIHAVAERHQRAVEPLPVLFAAMLNRWGHKGPAEIPPKRVYTFKYASRLAHDLGVPIRIPPAHPFNPLLALRIASGPMPAEERRTIIDALFDLGWARGESLTDPEAIAADLTSKGLDGPALVQRASDLDIKAALKSATEAAVDAGVFGVPSVDADGEMFWGQDSFPHLERFLVGGDPIPSGERARFEDLPVSAQRK